MRSRALMPLGTALLLSLVSPSMAWGLSLSPPPDPVTLAFTEALQLDLHTHLDDPLIDPNPENVFDLRNRLNVQLRWRALIVGTRLDAAWFPNPPAPPGQPTQYRDDLRPEELYATLRLKRWTLTLGDDHLALGRGIALSLRKMDELGFDVGLRGAHVQWRGRRVTARASVGLTNVINVDGVTEKKVPDPNDLVSAARLSVRPARWLKLGVQGVDIERRSSPVVDALSAVIPDGALRSAAAVRPVRTWIAGGTLELTDLGDVLNVYLEADGQQTSEARDTARGEVVDTRDGLALYGQVTAYMGAWTLLLEAKRYDHWDIESSPHPETERQQAVTQTFSYAVPPSLERFDQRVINNTDVTGAHVQLDHRLGRHDRLFVSAAGFLDAPGQGDFTVHSYAGWEHRTEGGDRWSLQAGYRHEEAPEDRIVRLRMVHLDGDLFVALGGPHDLQAHWSHEFRTKNAGQGPLEDSYVEGTSYVSWNWSPHWSFTAQFEYLNDTTTPQWWFPGAFVMYRFTQSTFVRLFGGRSKGGLKCSGGVCREFPDFEGVKLETTVRF